MNTSNSPSYLSDLVTTTANIPSVIHLRSARTRRYEPLTTRLKYGERCFSHAGPKAWNNLLHAVQEITNSNVFKHKLKTFLFEHASLDCDSFLPLVTLGVSIGQLGLN